MSDLNIRDLYLAPPEAGIKECTVSGWVRTVRDSKAFGFIELNDGTCFKNLQIVLEDGHTRDFASAVKITLGSAIRVTGELVLTPGMKQPFEVKASQVEVLGLCAPDFPLQKSAIPLSSCAPSRTFVPAPTRFTRCSASGRWRRSFCTPSLPSAALCTCTPPSSPPATARARARCFR